MAFTSQTCLAVSFLGVWSPFSVPRARPLWGGGGNSRYLRGLLGALKGLMWASLVSM